MKSAAAANQVSFERERGVYRVDVTRDLAHFVVTVGAESDRMQRLQRVFRILADAGIPIFLIKLHRTAVTFASDAARVEEVERSLQGVAIKCTARRDLALLTIVASSMRDLTGVMVNIADSLQQAGARLYGVGDSHNSVQCLIDGRNAAAAVKQLSRNFDLQGVDA